MSFEPPIERWLPRGLSPIGRTNGGGSAWDVVVPNYQLIRRIGEGAYGEVWLARDVLGLHRAVKVVHRHSFRDDHTYEREFRGIQQFEPISRTNDGLLDILHAGRNDAAGYYYYVMELADAVAIPEAEEGESPPRDHPGGTAFAMVDPGQYQPRTLQGELQRRRRLPVDECVQIGMNLTLAVAHLHRHGLIHRDIKPSNIIFVQGIPKLADIGLVTSFDATCSFVGTEGFVPPEGPVSPRADLYSLGKVLYELSSGRDRKDFPDPPTGLGEDRQGAGLEELNAVLLRACAPDPNLRYASAEGFHADLALLNSGGSVRAKRLVEKRLAFARKAGAVVGVIGLLAAAGYFFQRQLTRDATRLQREAEDLAARLERQKTQMQIQHAEDLFARGESSLAIAHLAQALRRHPDDRIATERLMSALSERNFPRPRAAWLFSGDKLDPRGSAGCARFSPDSHQVVMAAGDHSVRLWNWQAEGGATPIHQHSGKVLWVEFSPNGRWILSGSEDGTACILDARGGARVAASLEHDGPVRVARFDSSSRFAATAGGDSKARVYSVPSGALLHSLPHEGLVRMVAFSPDSRWVATASVDGAVAIWDLHTGQAVRRFPTGGATALVTFSPNGQWLAATVHNDEGSRWWVQVWDVRADRPEPTTLPHLSRLYTLEFSPDSERLVTATADDLARVWEVATGREQFQVRHSAIVYAAAFSPDGRTLLTASVDRTARVWDASTGAALGEPMHHEGRILHAEFDPTGARMLTVGWEDRAVKVWELPIAGTFTSVLPHTNWVASATSDPGGREVVTATGAGISTATALNQWRSTNEQHWVVAHSVSTGFTNSVALRPRGAEAIALHLGAEVRRALVAQRLNVVAMVREAWVWDLARGEPLTTDALRLDAEITCAQFSPDGARVAIGTVAGTARVFDSVWGNSASPPLTHRGRIHSVGFSPDGAALVTASDDRTAVIWNSTTGERLASLAGHEDLVWRARFSPDGRHLVTVSSDRTARVWSTNGTLVTVLRHRAAVEHAEFSPDGSLIATASADGTARIWSATTGRPISELRHSKMVMTVRFSPDGRRVITASLDGTAQVWDAATGLKLGDPIRHDDAVVSATFSPDGRLAITASLDGSAIVREVPIASLPIPAWLPELAESIGGQRLNNDGVPETVSWVEQVEVGRRLTTLPETNDFTRWVKRPIPSEPRSKSAME